MWEDAPRQLAPALFAEFNADACVEILDVDEFLQRCNDTISRQTRFSESGLLHERVEYYAPNRKVERDISEARWLPFFKHGSYSHQEEYRLAAALKGGA